MSCDNQISTQNLIDAKSDAVTLGEVATSRLGAESAGAPITESTNRFGETTDTVQGRLNKLGVIYDDPIRDWSASLLVSDLRAHRYPATTGDIYIPTKPLPFTTGGTFNANDWALYQLANLNDDLTQSHSFRTQALMSSSLVEFPINKPLSVNGESGQYINYVVTSADTGFPLAGGVFAQRLTDYQGKIVFDISDLSDSVDNRAYVYGLGVDVFIAEGETVRINLLADDDVNIFKGLGTILSLDQWGNEQVFSVKLANQGSKYTSRQMISDKLFKVKHQADVTELTLGVVGDSVTDGADADAWVTNPTSGDNLSSTNYDHSANGGINSWFRVFGSWCNAFCGIPGNFFPTYNAAKTGRALYDGWAYRNFDYGFFQNSAYGNKAPDVCYLAMGINDGPIMSDTDVYADKFEQFIRKAWGYGSSVCMISLHSNYYWTAELEGAIKLRLGQDFNKVDVINIGAYIEKLASSENIYDLNALYSDGGALFDFTHPNNIGHRYLGASLAKEYFDDHIISGVGTITNLFSTSKSQFFDFPSYNRLPANAENSGFENKSTIVKYDPSTSNVLGFVDVWVEPNEEVVLKNYKAPIRTNASAGDVLSVYGNDPTSIPYFNSIDQVYANDTYSGTLAQFLGELAPGLNRIQLTYDGLPTQIYPPEICINEGSNMEGVSETISQPPYILAYDVTAPATFTKTIQGKKLRNASYSRIKHDQCYDISAIDPFPIEISILVHDISEKAGFVLLDKNDKGIYLGLNNKALGQWNVYTYSGNILTPLTNKQFGQEPTYITKLILKTDASNAYIYMSQDDGDSELIFTIPKIGDSYSGGKPINFGTFDAGEKSVSATCSVRTR